MEIIHFETWPLECVLKCHIPIHNAHCSFEVVRYYWKIFTTIYDYQRIINIVIDLYILVITKSSSKITWFRVDVKEIFKYHFFRLSIYLVCLTFPWQKIERKDTTMKSKRKVLKKDFMKKNRKIIAMQCVISAHTFPPFLWPKFVKKTSAFMSSSYLLHVDEKQIIKSFKSIPHRKILTFKYNTWPLFFFSDRKLKRRRQYKNSGGI